MAFTTVNNWSRVNLIFIPLGLLSLFSTKCFSSIITGGWMVVSHCAYFLSLDFLHYIYILIMSSIFHIYIFSSLILVVFSDLSQNLYIISITSSLIIIIFIDFFFKSFSVIKCFFLKVNFYSYFFSYSLQSIVIPLIT